MITQPACLELQKILQEVLQPRMDDWFVVTQEILAELHKGPIVIYCRVKNPTGKHRE